MTEEHFMTLQAGAAVRDISPAKSLPLFGYPHVERMSTGNATNF